VQSGPGETIGELPLDRPNDLTAPGTAARGYRTVVRARSAAERSGVLAGLAADARGAAEMIAPLCHDGKEGKDVAAGQGRRSRCRRLFDFYCGRGQRIYGRVLVRPAGTLFGR